MKQKPSLIEFFNEESPGVGVAYKNKMLKKAIIRQLNNESDLTIPELSRDLKISIPKTTELVNELIKQGMVLDLGKIDSTGGRRANIYGLLSTACYFVGVDVRRYYINIGVMDFKKHMVKIEEKIPYRLDNTPEALQELIAVIKKFLKDCGIVRSKILSVGISLSGGVNNVYGYSYSFFHFQEKPLAAVIQAEIGISTFLENDSNAMAYAEYMHGVVSNEKDLIFINLDYGTGSGIIIGGNVYYGKSGFSGEFGHIPFFANDIICSCGKKGCLETEVSGGALLRQVRASLANGVSSQILKQKKKPEDLKLEDLIAATRQEDMLLIELLSTMGEKLGRGLAVLISIFNPELVIIGGPMAETGEYLRLPVRSAINKYSLSLMNNDTQLKTSKLGERAGVIGACLIARNKVLVL
jgi:predicted NBD/HSP70 family sugar kinase